MKTERFSHLISRVFATEPIELDCSQVQTLLPAFVEAELQEEDLGAAGAAMRVHFHQCPDCAQTYLALAHVTALVAEEGLPAAETLLEGWPAPKGIVS